MIMSVLIKYQPVKSEQCRKILAGFFKAADTGKLLRNEFSFFFCRNTAVEKNSRICIKNTFHKSSKCYFINSGGDKRIRAASGHFFVAFRIMNYTRLIFNITKRKIKGGCKP